MAVMEKVLKRTDTRRFAPTSAPISSSKTNVVCASDESVRAASAWAMAKNQEAYLELARYDSN